MDNKSASDPVSPTTPHTASATFAMQLRRFVEMIPTVGWQAAPDGQFQFFTKYFQDYTGLTPDEYLGMGWNRAIHPDDLPSLLETWSAIRASGQPGDLNCRVRRFDGEYRFVTAHTVPYRDEQGVIQGWYGCSLDIEEHKQTERQQRSGAQELRGAMDIIGGLIAVIDHDGSALYMNEGLRQYSGLTITDISLKEFRETVMHPADGEVYERHPAEIKAGVAFKSVFRLRRHDGQYRWHQVQYNPLRNDENVIIRWYATGIDVHEQHMAAMRLENENIALREEITRSSMLEEIVGSSEPMRRVLSCVQRVAKSDSTVLITGETGTGKELIARAVHMHSLRAAKAFIRVNCAAIPPPLIASELFGHEKGAFTGALHKRLGRFEAADGGTLFLDEIGDLPTETQIALLRVLQEREFERIGSQESISVDVRVVAATNVDLAARMAAGTFRQDLFYRLNVFPIALPSLRERSEDIPLLVEYFVERYARKAGKHIKRIDGPTLELLRKYKWPGNIRELQNVIERSVILCDCDVFSIDASWLKNAADDTQALPHTLSVELASREKELIERALEAAGGRVAGPTGAAARLNMPRQMLTSKMKALGIPKR
jgi:formate hydrogenlyase transcriptional activator